MLGPWGAALSGEVSFLLACLDLEAGKISWSSFPGMSESKQIKRSLS